MKLPIQEKAEITLFTHHSLPLLIPFITPQTEGWYMNSFINIFYRYEHPTFYDYTDYKCFYSGIMDTDTFTFDTALQFNTTDFFKKCICSNKYIYAWVDQFFVSATPHHDREHNIHPILIYGFDEDWEVYHCKCFCVERGVYSADIAMEEYHKALEQAARIDLHINDDEVFCLFKIRDDIKYDFSIGSFVNELYDYTVGKGRYKEAYFFKSEYNVDSEYNYDISCYGLKVTFLLAKGLQKRQLRWFDYRIVHMICENKKNILMRLRYIAARYAGYHVNAYESLVDEYAQIVDGYEKFRLLAMKKSITENHSLYDLDYIDKTAHGLYTVISELVRREQNTLPGILRELAELHIRESFAHKSVCRGLPISDNERSTTGQFTDGLVLYSCDGIFRGTLTVDEETIHIDDARADNIYYHPTHKKITRVDWQPLDHTYPTSVSMHYAINGWPNNCLYIPSTTYPSDTVSITAQNLGEYTNDFWCPDVVDPEPCVEFRFDSPTAADTLVVIQHYVERRIGELRVEVRENAQWVTIAVQEVPDGRQVIRLTFDPVVGDRYRVRFTKRIRSSNGFDIPNILYMRIIEDAFSR